ncbi:MAG: hypothetical protein R3246_16025, partial [Acidimicrobiia bacterium]|nr:hypothetical protein [Acidimicrobiia bacterium]
MRLPEQAESAFVELSGSLDVQTAMSAMVGDDSGRVVIRYDDDFWLLTEDEFHDLLRGAEPSSRLGEIVAAATAPAWVHDADAGSLPRLGDRIVIVDAGDVLAIVLETTEEALVGDEPPPDRGPTRSFRPPATRDDPVESDADEQWFLETSFPRQVALGSVSSLVVELNSEVGAGPDLTTLAVELSTGAEVDVVVQAKRGFEIDGAFEGTLQAVDDGIPIRFQLRATSEGLGSIRVLFFVEATNLGVITLEPEVVAAGDQPDS